MMNKRRFYFAAVGILVIGLALFAARSPRPEMRQPRSGTPVHEVTKQFLLKKNTKIAKFTAERMDKQALQLIEASSSTWLNRWWNNIDLKALEQTYTKDLSLHMQAMAEVMKARREAGGSLQKLDEFDFQNMLRHSDYVLSTKLSSARVKRVSTYVQQSYKAERKFTSLRPMLASN